MTLDLFSSIDELKAFGNKPRVHGNGFVQLDLNSDTRLNIWGHPDIPAQKISTQVHNHRFTFTSKVLTGDLVHTIYKTHEPWSEIEEVYTHDIYRCESRKGEDTRLVNTGWSTCIYEYDTQVLLTGMSYELKCGEYHQIDPVEPSATLMTKLQTFSVTPYVLVEIGQKPDNDFDRHSFSEAELWEIISEVLEST